MQSPVKVKKNFDEKNIPDVHGSSGRFVNFLKNGASYHNKVRVPLFVSETKHCWTNVYSNLLIFDLRNRRKIYSVDSGFFLLADKTFENIFVREFLNKHWFPDFPVFHCWIRNFIDNYDISIICIKQKTRYSR